MKKLLSFALACTLILTLSACKSDPTLNETSNLPNTSSGDSVPNELDQDVTGNTEQEQDDLTEQEPTGVSIQKTVLVDESGIKITAESLSLSSLAGPTVMVSIENNTGKTLGIKTKDSSINGYTVDSYLADFDIESGSTNSYIQFLQTDMNEAGITEVGTMRMAFYLYDPESFDSYLETDPIELKTSIADETGSPDSPNGEVVYEKDGIKVVMAGLVADDSTLGEAVAMYAENSSDTPVLIKLQDVLLNEYVAETPFSMEVMPGEKAAGNITFELSTIVNNGIKSIDSMRITLQVMEKDTYRILDESEQIYLNFD